MILQLKIHPVAVDLAKSAQVLKDIYNCSCSTHNSLACELFLDNLQGDTRSIVPCQPARACVCRVCVRARAGGLKDSPAVLRAFSLLPWKAQRWPTLGEKSQESYLDEPSSRPSSFTRRPSPV